MAAPGMPAATLVQSGALSFPAATFLQEVSAGNAGRHFFTGSVGRHSRLQYQVHICPFGGIIGVR